MSRSVPGVLLIVVSLSLPALARQSPTPPEEPKEEGKDALVLDPIVVTGSRTEQRLSDSPVAVELITREDIASSGAENAADLLEEHPGVQMLRTFGGAGVRMQGLDPKHVMVMIDGEQVGGRIDGVIDMSRIPVEDIERIEIVKGPSCALYGSDAMGGVVHIITRRTQKTYEAELHGSYGHLNAADVSTQLGLNLADWNVRLSGGWHQLDAFDLSPEDAATSGSALSQWNLANRTEYRFNDKTTLVLSASYQRRDRQGVDANDAGAIFDRRNLTETFSASLGPEFRLSGPSNLRIKAHYNLFRDQYLLDQRNSGALDKDEETYEHQARFTVQYDRLLAGNHMVTAGLEGVYERLSSARLGPGTGDRLKGAFFVQDEWSVLDAPLLVVVPGGRLDFDEQLGLHATPKIALRFDPHETVTLRTSYGMGFRAPVFKELLLLFENPSVGYVVEGNPELGPESSHSVNLGVAYRPGKWGWFSLNLFRNDIDDLIFTELIDDGGGSVPLRYSYINVASAYTQGVEARVRVKPLSGLSLDGGYVLTDSENRELGRPLQGRALHQGSVDVRFRHQPWRFDVSVRAAIIGSRPYYVDIDDDGVAETVDADPYATVDVRLGQGLGEHVSLFLGVENILDAGDPVYLPIQPRNFYGGINARL